jgi:hypothetical protein
MYGVPRVVIRAGQVRRLRVIEAVEGEPFDRLHGQHKHGRCCHGIERVRDDGPALVKVPQWPVRIARQALVWQIRQLLHPAHVQWNLIGAGAVVSVQ